MLKLLDDDKLIFSNPLLLYFIKLIADARLQAIFATTGNHAWKDSQPSFFKRNKDNWCRWQPA
jgi:hypothetical protein